MVWAAPPPWPPLGPRNVHLWRGALERPPGETAALSMLLAPMELARRDRFVFEPDRNRYAIARALLRIILSRYLGGRPGEVRLAEDENGKPRVPGASLHFNVSHSGGMALFAVAEGRRVGVDLERERIVSEAGAIAARWFGPSERRLLEATPDGERERAFLECWTSKEAQVKALGNGLQTPLAQIDIWRGVAQRNYRMGGRRMGDGESWTLRQIAAGQGLVASLVVEGDDDWILSTFEAGPAIVPGVVV